MKTLSIIGIIWFSVCFIFGLAYVESDVNASAGWGFLGVLYAIPYSIVGLIKSKEWKQQAALRADDLQKLHELKENGIISETDFLTKKNEFLGYR